MDISLQNQGNPAASDSNSSGSGGGCNRGISTDMTLQRGARDSTIFIARKSGAVPSQ